MYYIILCISMYIMNSQRNFQKRSQARKMKKIKQFLAINHSRISI